MKRSCDSCGTVYEAKRSTSRYCKPACRTRAARAMKAGRPVGQVVAMRPGTTGPGEMEQATLDELDRVGRVDTVLGKAVVVLARGIDTAPAESGSSQAARFREWQSMLVKAMAGAAGEKSPLDRARDELAARRARRGA